MTPLVSVLGTWLSTLAAPAQGLATLPDTQQACWAWRGQRAGPAAPGSHPCRGHGHRVTALPWPWTQRGDQRASGQGWPECGGSGPPLDPLPLTHGQAPNCSVRTHCTARLTRAPHTHGLLTHAGSSTAGCPVERPASSAQKGTAPSRPRLPACGQLRGPSMGCSLCNDEFLLGPRWTPGHGQGLRWPSPALGSRRHQQAHAEISVLGDRGLPHPVGGLGPARRVCPLLSGHKQRPSGPASEAALGRAPPLRAQKLSGGRQPVPPQGGLFACCSAESPSIRCTQELRGLICFSIGALSLHFLKGLPQAEVSDLMKCDLLMFLLI